MNFGVKRNKSGICVNRVFLYLSKSNPKNERINQSRSRNYSGYVF